MCSVLHRHLTLVWTRTVRFVHVHRSEPNTFQYVVTHIQDPWQFVQNSVWSPPPKNNNNNNNNNPTHNNNKPTNHKTRSYARITHSSAKQTHLWPLNNVTAIKPTMNLWTPSKVKPSSVWTTWLKQCSRKPVLKVLSNRERPISLEYIWKLEIARSSGIFIIYSL